ncbi:CobW family GTP-binding protein [Pelagibaculum spongiae]|uniref:GTP-binding protein n=1 Tax=Pelagibaculum spongiae TaxID=2080658 RepID=A0A2V1GSW0_9GAMM|nr:GTP-binding protein [Pelagibaculum spongiae]PVZ68795.1 GTP-binding protein [Pelagibaculum spongiae]
MINLAVLLKIKSRRLTHQNSRARRSNAIVILLHYADGGNLEITMAIPVNIVTGFLGVGKTTSIINLVKQKSQKNQTAERWAVLINEFGTVGIDAAILQSQVPDQQLAIKEVPGGCLCCTAGLPFQIGLNQLISKQRPDRLIIEPTGLGHLSEIIKTLQAEHYQDVLQLQSVICLVDPVALSDARYIEHEVFQDQLQQADVVLANKIDQSSAKDIEIFEQLIERLQPAISAKVEQGKIEAEWLNLPHKAHLTPAHGHQHADHQTPALSGASLQGDEDWRRFESKGQGYVSCGWIVVDAAIFDEIQLLGWVSGQQVERIKGVVRTNQGWRIINVRDGIASMTSIDEAADSRLEMIHSDVFDIEIAEQSFLQAIVSLDK